MRTLRIVALQCGKVRVCPSNRARGHTHEPVQYPLVEELRACGVPDDFGPGRACARRPDSQRIPPSRRVITRPPSSRPASRSRCCQELATTTNTLAFQQPSDGTRTRVRCVNGTSPFEATREPHDPTPDLALEGQVRGNHGFFMSSLCTSLNGRRAASGLSGATIGLIGSRRVRRGHRVRRLRRRRAGM